MKDKVKELSPKEFLKLPIEERQKLLVEQSNDPEIVAYYREVFQLFEPKTIIGKAKKRPALVFPPEYYEEPKGGKPPVLSKEVYESIVMGYGNKAYADILPVLEAQRDADLPYIEQAKEGMRLFMIEQHEIECALCKVSQEERLEQARQETEAISYSQGVLDGRKQAGGEIFEEIETNR